MESYYGIKRVNLFSHFKKKFTILNWDIRKNMTTKKGKDNFFCSFCGKKQTEVEKLIAGPEVYICNHCVLLCRTLMNDADRQDQKPPAGIALPSETKNKLDEYVVEQEIAKKVISVALYNHCKRNQFRKFGNDVEIMKSNILLIGPTGTGKTLLAQALAKLLDVPFAMADATTLTEAGYVGEDVENIILYLLQNAEYDLERAQRGIVYIDEIDKIARRFENSSVRDVSGEGVQQALLKIMEGTIASVPPKGGRKHPQQDFLKVDTSEILFICGGAFVGLEKIIQKRLGKRKIGFAENMIPEKNKESGNILDNVEAEDLIKYGFIPEFIGRLPVIATLHDLSENALLKILHEPKNALIKQYKKLFEMENVKLNFTENALNAIVREAVKRKAGARGLRSIMESCMLDIMFEIPSHKNVTSCMVTEEVVLNHARPILDYRPVKKHA